MFRRASILTRYVSRNQCCLKSNRHTKRSLYFGSKVLTDSKSQPANDSVSFFLGAMAEQKIPVEGTNKQGGSHLSSQLLDELRRHIDEALLARRSHEQGDLFPRIVAEKVSESYLLTGDDKENKIAFFSLLIELGTHSHEEIASHCQRVLKSMGKDDSLVTGVESRLRNRLSPLHQHLFVELGKLNNGVGLLVDMRKDFLDLKSTNAFPHGCPKVKLFDDTLKANLSQWFSTGFLDLQRITWDSQASLLEKVAESERVHPMRDLLEAKQRVGPMRRCFIYTHHLLPGQPLVVLHIALNDDYLFDNIQDIIAKAPNSNVDPRDIKSATFYSISSTNKGLAGIDLGNALIKTAVEKLKLEFEHIITFGTLSPIPGFRKWLDTKLLSVKESIEGSLSILNDLNVSQIQQLYHCSNYNSCLIKLKEILSDETWVTDKTMLDAVKAPMMQLCARYLCEEKRRRAALDPVANFHLSNGALVERINWMANTNKNGIKSSYGLMVNYKYDIDEILVNNYNYIVQNQIVMSDDVKILLSRKSKL